MLYRLLKILFKEVLIVSKEVTTKIMGKIKVIIILCFIDEKWAGTIWTNYEGYF